MKNVASSRTRNFGMLFIVSPREAGYRCSIPVRWGVASRVIINKRDLEERYPEVDLDGFIPTHRVEVRRQGTKTVLREDFVELSEPNERGLCFGIVPGEDEPFYALIPPKRWQCLEVPGLVKAYVVKYRPDHVRPGERQGVVYFIQAGEDGPIKIGWSSDVEKRIAQLQTANAHKLILLGTIPGSLQDESAIHAMFDHLRLEAEWFRDSPEIRLYVAEKGGGSSIQPSN
jgi:hypothetical protein